MRTRWTVFLTMRRTARSRLREQGAQVARRSLILHFTGTPLQRRPDPTRFLGASWDCAIDVDTPLAYGCCVAKPLHTVVETQRKALMRASQELLEDFGDSR